MHGFWKCDTPLAMDLRSHPLISYRGIHTWPPVWTWAGGSDDSHPRGEVGILTQVNVSCLPAMRPKRAANRLFLYIDYNGGEYIGCLLFDDSAFCRQLGKLLQEHYGRSIKDLGDLEVGHTV